MTLSNALLAVVHPRAIPEAGSEPGRFGAWVENACLAFAWNSGYRVAYWREEPLEVDGVIDGNRGAWAVEVKTGAFGTADLRGLLEFTRRFPRYQPLLLCDPAELPVAARLGVPEAFSARGTGSGWVDPVEAGEDLAVWWVILRTGIREPCLAHE